MVILRARDQSRFTYKNLLDLNDTSRAYKSPLAVVCHIDLNAFFAQCEQLRLGLSLADPVVCVQWSSLIAVSYAAREYGITRMDRLEQAKLKCPNLIPVHTAVFKKGQPLWKYVDYMPSPTDHKVSLDPYRREGKKVLDIFRSECDLVEKASVDESFMDLGRLVFKEILLLFPNLLEEMSDPSDFLKPLKTLPANLEFKGYIIGKNDEAENGSSVVDDEHDYLIEDWDDLCMLLGSIICFNLRKKVENELGYKTSGGVGRVKTIAKLASDFQKPDQQTIVRNDSISTFVKYFKLTDFWSLGGKLGAYVKEKLGEDISISSLRDTYDSTSKLAKMLDSDIELANKLFKIVRGELYAEIENKILIKSMMANKNFRGKSVSNTKDFVPWIDVFVSELTLRIQDLDEEYNTNLRPIKMTLSVMNSNMVRHSKQCSINQPPKDYETLRRLFYTLSKDLVSGLEENWKAQSPGSQMYPIQQAGLGVSIFKDISTRNTLDDLIQNVGKKKVDPSRIVERVERLEELPAKKPKIKNSIDTLLMLKGESPTNSNDIKKNSSDLDIPKSCAHCLDKKESEENVEKGDPTILCSKCGEKINKDDWQIHEDYHVAINLEGKINMNLEETYGFKLLKNPNRKKPTPTKKKKSDKSQSQLPF